MHAAIALDLFGDEREALFFKLIFRRVVNVSLRHLLDEFLLVNVAADAVPVGDQIVGFARFAKADVVTTIVGRDFDFDRCPIASLAADFDIAFLVGVIQILQRPRQILFLDDLSFDASEM